MKNTIITTGYVMIHCPFCVNDTRHEVNFKHYGFDNSVQKQNVAFNKTCTNCESWIVSVLTVMLKDDWENLKVVK